MKVFKYSLAVIAAVLLSAVSIQATHVAGGSMSYRCLGNDRYEVKLEFRRDCFNGAENAQFDSLAHIFIYNDDQLVFTIDGDGIVQIPFMRDDTLIETLTSECNVIGGDVCVQTTMYMDTIILPPIPNGYILAYQRCCRNRTLNNIINPLSTGATYWVNITEAALQNCNSSPSFSKWPAAYICVNDTLRFDHSAVDDDGDSLFYYMCTPSLGASEEFPQPRNDFTNPQVPGPPFDKVQYASGFSENNMMGGSPISIDERTGQILAVPTLEGQYLIGVCVREFRDGVLLSEVRRDFEYNVRLCGRDPIAIIEPGFITQCDSLSVQFINNSTSNFKPIDSLDYTWVFDYPTGNLVSNEMEPLYTYPSPGLYDVAMIVTDGVCIDTAFTRVGVSVPFDPLADFSWSSFDCDGETEVQLNNLTQANQSVEYEWIITSASGTQTSSLRDPTINIGQDTIIDVSLRVIGISGCEDFMAVNDISLITIPLRGNFIDQIICNGDAATIFTTDIPNLNVDISPSANIEHDGLGNYVYPNFTGTQDFIVSINDGFCFLEDTVTIVGADDPSFVLEDIIQCGDGIVSLNPNGPSFYTYSWVSPQGVPIIRNEPNPAVSLANDGEFYVTISTSPGSSCFFTDTVRVGVVDVPLINILPAQQFIYCENTDVEVSLDRDYPGITWIESETGFILGTGQSITLSSLANSLEIEVVVTDDNGCINNDFVDIQYIEAPRFEIDPISDTRVCLGDDAVLIAESDDQIDWLSDNGTVLGSGPQLDLNNLSEDMILTVVATNDLGCIFERDVVLTVLDNPEVDFTPLEDIVICENQIFTLELNSSNEVEWLTESGEVLGSGSSITIDNVDRDTTVVVTVTNPAGCSVTNEFTIDVDEMVQPDVDFSDLEALATCINSGLEIELNTDDEVRWYDEDGTLIGEGSPLILNSLTESMVLQVEVEDDHRCTARDTFMVNIFEEIGLSIDLGQDTISYCQGESLNIVSTSSVSNLTSQWFLEDNLIAEGQNLDDYMPEGDQLLVLFAFDDFGCVDKDSIFLIESITDATLTGDSFICLGEETTLEFTPASDVGYSLDWSPDDFTVSEDGSILIVAPTETTTFTALYVNLDGCEKQVQFTVNVDGFFDGLSAQADPYEIFLGQSSELFTDTDIDFDHVWTPSESLDDANSAEPIATPHSTTIYTVTVTDENGCMAIDTVELRVIQPSCDEEDVFVPNMFTPNGDNFNDTWRIESNFVDEFEVVVYDRWGEKVFESFDQDVEWDGVYKNKELEPDVYGYYLKLVCINGFEYSKQGNVTLVK